MAMYNIVLNGRACDVAIKEQENFGYGTGLSERAKTIFNTELCKRCKIAHKHYCEEAEAEDEVGEDGKISLDSLKTASADIRDLLDNELSLWPGTGGSVTPGDPAPNTQQSFAPFMDPNSDSGISGSFVLGENGAGRDSAEVLSVDDCGSKRRKRKRLLKKILLLKLLDEDDEDDEDENDLPQVGMRSNYNGIPDSSLNPPSGADGATPGSNLSAAPVGGTLSQI